MYIKNNEAIETIKQNTSKNAELAIFECLNGDLLPLFPNLTINDCVHIISAKFPFKTKKISDCYIWGRTFKNREDEWKNKTIAIGIKAKNDQIALIELNRLAITLNDNNLRKSLKGIINSKSKCQYEYLNQIEVENTVHIPIKHEKADICRYYVYNAELSFEYENKIYMGKGSLEHALVEILYLNILITVKDKMYMTAKSGHIYEVNFTDDDIPYITIDGMLYSVNMDDKNLIKIDANDIYITLYDNLVDQTIKTHLDVDKLYDAISSSKMISQTAMKLQKEYSSIECEKTLTRYETKIVNGFNLIMKSGQFLKPKVEVPYYVGKASMPHFDGNKKWFTLVDITIPLLATYNSKEFVESHKAEIIEYALDIIVHSKRWTENYNFPTNILKLSQITLLSTSELFIQFEPKILYREEK